jgi:hypothetical protein
MVTEMWRAMTGHEQVKGRLAGGFGCGMASQTSSAMILEQIVVSNQFSPISTVVEMIGIFWLTEAIISWLIYTK